MALDDARTTRRGCCSAPFLLRDHAAGVDCVPQVEVAAKGTVARLPERIGDHFGATSFSDRFQEFSHPLRKQLAPRYAVFPQLLMAYKFRTRVLEIARVTSVGFRHLSEQHLAGRSWPGCLAGFLLDHAHAPTAISVQESISNREPQGTVATSRFVVRLLRHPGAMPLEQGKGGQ